MDNVDIMLGGLPVMLASSPVSFDDEEMKDIMHDDEVTITVDLHAGHEKELHGGVIFPTITLRLMPSTILKLSMIKS